MRRSGFLVLAVLWGCAHQPSSGLTVDDEAAIEIEAFRAAMLYPGDADSKGDLDAVTAGHHFMMCLGIYVEPSNARLEDPSPRVVRTLTERGALVSPASQCRNPGIEPPLLFEGSRVQNVGLLLDRFGPVHQELVSVEAKRGCFRRLVGSSCIGYQQLFLKLKRTAHGWVTQDIVEGTVVD
jgi:hypothetical protein